MNLMISRTGALYCFCEEHITVGGEKRDQKYQFTYSKLEAGLNDSGITETLDLPICKVYFSYMTGFGYMLE